MTVSVSAAMKTATQQHNPANKLLTMFLFLFSSCILFESSQIDLSSVSTADTAEPSWAPAPPTIELLLPVVDTVEENIPTLFKIRVRDPNYELEELTLAFISDQDGAFCAPILENTEEAYCEAILSVGQHSLEFAAYNPDFFSAKIIYALTVQDASQIDNDGDGFSENEGDCDDSNALISPNGTETIDNVDEDCNGLIDDHTDIFDDDGDGFSENDGDCDDTEAAFSPEAQEICDEIDQNCNGLIDDGTECYDDDDDGFTEEDGDCNDNEADSFPNNPEIADGIDNNCDGNIDEGSAFFDDDGDCFCETLPCYDSVNANCAALAEGDCDDNNAAFSPNAFETCDGLDNDCNGLEDDNALDGSVFYLDADGDGRGDPNHPTILCNRISGYVANTADCNDAEPLAWIGAPEYCDGVDNDCDNQTDELGAVDCTDYYVDGDLDGFGDPAYSQCQCAPDSVYVTTVGDDCYDANPDARPSQTAFFDQDRGDGSFDYDCNYSEEKQFPLTSICSFQVCDDGWANAIPACGMVNSYEYDCFNTLAGCYFDNDFRTQTCR